MMKELRSALCALVLLTLVGGGVYPLLVTGVARLVPEKARGSLVTHEARVVGSRLIGQEFSELRYFWGRPSAVDYHAEGSGASNLGPASEAYVTAIAARVKAVQRGGASVPADLVMASGSGLDPHISPDAALYQIPRVADARGMDPEALAVLVKQYTRAPLLGVFGQARVNVLELNLALDAQK